MTGDPVALVKALGGGLSNRGLYFLLDQAIGHREVMSVDGYMVVDVNPGLLPLCVDIRLCGQWL